MWSGQRGNMWRMDDRRLANFWSHQRAASQWMDTHRQAREYAINDSSSKADRQQPSFQRKYEMAEEFEPGSSPLPSSVENEVSDSLQNSGTDELSQNAGEDIGLSDEMAAFFRQTIEHRKQRDASSNKEARTSNEENKRLGIEEDDYVMADKIGVYGLRKRSLSLPNEPEVRKKKLDEMKKLYGIDAEKILAMETHLDLRFEQNYSQSGAHLWPNIPLNL